MSSSDQPASQDSQTPGQKVGMWFRKNGWKIAWIIAFLVIAPALLTFGTTTISALTNTSTIISLKHDLSVANATIGKMQTQIDDFRTANKDATITDLKTQLSTSQGETTTALKDKAVTDVTNNGLIRDNIVLKAQVEAFQKQLNQAAPAVVQPTGPTTQTASQQDQSQGQQQGVVPPQQTVALSYTPPPEAPRTNLNRAMCWPNREPHMPCDMDAITVDGKVVKVFVSNQGSPWYEAKYGGMPPGLRMHDRYGKPTCWVDDNGVLHLYN